jgi:hypothetical protein
VKCIKVSGGGGGGGGGGGVIGVTAFCGHINFVLGL